MLRIVCNFRKSRNTHCPATEESDIPQSQTDYSTSISDILVLYNRAKEHHVYSENNQSRNLEAFLMLIVLFERVITLLGLVLLEKENNLTLLHKTREDRYNIDRAIDDVYLLGGISNDEFKKLKEFRKNRNECVHEIFNKRKNKDVEIYTYKCFEKHKDVFELMVEKLERELK